MNVKKGIWVGDQKGQQGIQPDQLNPLLTQMPDGHPKPDSEAEMNQSLKENCPSFTDQHQYQLDLSKLWEKKFITPNIELQNER